MKTVGKLVLFVFFIAYSTAFAYGNQTNRPIKTNPDAMKTQQLVEHAINFLNTHGLADAKKAFLSDGRFLHGSTYVFMHKMSGKNKGMVIAHPYRRHRINKSDYNLKVNGGYPIRKLINKAQQGGGWVTYMFYEPRHKVVRKKCTFVLPVKKYNVLVGSGYYLTSEKEHCPTQ